MFERGLKAIPLSIDLWIHYLTHIKQKHQGDRDAIRAQFERAIEACGLEFRSDKVRQKVLKKNQFNKFKTFKSISVVGRLYQMGE